MNLASSLRSRASGPAGRALRSGLSALRDMARFIDARDIDQRLRALRAVLRAACWRSLRRRRIERAAHGVVAHARQVLDAAAADQHHRVLLQVVAFAADVADDLVAVGQAHLGDLAQRRVRLLRRGRVDARADAATLRAVRQRRRRALVVSGLRGLRTSWLIVAIRALFRVRPLSPYAKTAGRPIRPA